MESGQKKKKTSSSKTLDESRKSGHSGVNVKGERAEKKGRRQFDLMFANIIEKMNEGFVALDSQMNYIYLNERGSELLKRDPADLIGNNYWEVYPQDKDTAFGRAYRQALETQIPIELEDYYGYGDRWFENRIYPSENGLSIFFSDITERKQAEEALRQKDKQLHRVTDVTPILFSHCSRDLRYLFVNRAAAEFLGLPAEEIIGRPIREIMGDDAFHAVLPYIERVLNGEQVEYELKIPYRVMGPRFMHVVYIPDKDDNGNVAGWIATATDITERKHMEDERIRLLAGEQALRAEAEYAKVEAEQAEAEAERAKGEAERELAERKLAEEALGIWVDAPLPQDARPAWLRYGIALAATAIMILFRTILDPLLGDSIQYSLLLGAVAFSVWYGGIGPALFSILIGYLGVGWLVLGWETILAPTVISVTSLILFLFSSVLVIALGRAMSRVQHHAHQSACVSFERKRQLEIRLQEQERVEAALRESERKFSLIYNRLPFAAALSNPTDGVISDVNHEFENVFGYARHEAIGKTSLELGINPDQGQRTRVLAELLLTGSAHNLELTLLTRTQRERFFLVNLDLVELEGQKHILQTAQDITERKRAEETLRESEARLLLLTGISELIRKTEDPDELLYAVSNAVGEHLQVRRCLFNETDVENDLEIVHRDYYDGVESVAGIHKVSDYSSITSAEMQAGRTVVNFDSKVDERTAADYERTYQLTGERAYVAVPMLRENRWIATLWVSDDVPRTWSPEEISLLETVAERTWAATEKLRIDGALRDSEGRLRLATQAAQMFTWELDIQRQTSTVADNFAEALGFSPALIPTDNSGLLQRFIHPEDGEIILHALTEAVQKQHDLRAVQYRVVHPETGEAIWLEVNGKITYDTAGNPGKMFGVAQNINERRQMEEALRQLEERFSKAFHASPVLKIILRADNEQIVDINESNAATFEYTRSETLGKPVRQVFGFPDEEKFEALFNDLQAGGSIESQEVTIRTSSGRSRNVLFSAHPVSLTGEKHFLYTILDITARKQAEAALQQLNLDLERRVERRTAQLQSANQALEESQKRLQVLSQRLVEVQEEERRAIARELHDRVGQTLSALNLNLAIINSQLSALVNEEVNARLSDSIRLVADVISLVRDVMANLRPTVLDDFGLEAALQMYLEDFRARYLISTQFEKDASLLPRLGASIEMTLLRITQECLLNVARHAQAKQVALSIQMEGNTVRLIIQDDGIGIQSWQLANRPGGHGLMIMRERAEAVSGNLRVSSAPGRGTQIEVSIPLQTKTLDGNSS